MYLSDKKRVRKALKEYEKCGKLFAGLDHTSQTITILPGFEKDSVVNEILIELDYIKKLLDLEFHHN